MVVPMKHKSDAFQEFKRFKAYAENATGKKINKGGEYMSKEFQNFIMSPYEFTSKTHSLSTEDLGKFFID